MTEQVLLINQDKVLVETVDLLSQCLKETEDQLMRENMVGTAAFINCVNGGNGRQIGYIAVVKSSLIELKAA